MSELEQKEITASEAGSQEVRIASTQDIVEDDGNCADGEQTINGAQQPNETEGFKESAQAAQTPVIEDLTLVVSAAHEMFTLDKKVDDDETLGLPNNRNVVCEYCGIVLIPQGYATKVSNETHLIQKTLRDYDLCQTYWYVNDIEAFQNIWIHQLDGDLKYLCCLSC